MKRKLIKVTLKFFLIMLCLTFLSRAANNFTIAAADIVETRQMSIDHTIELEGRIAYSRTQAVVTEPNQLLSDMYVQVGEHITEGDALFKVDIDDLVRQINRQKTEIDKLNLAIKDAVSAREVAKENQSRDIKKAQVELARAQETGERELIWVAELALEEASASQATDSTLERTTLDRDEKIAEMKRLEHLQKTDGVVVAPIAGTVIKLEHAVGERTSDNATLILADNTANPQFRAQAVMDEEKRRQLLANGENGVAVVGTDNGGKDYTLENLTLTSLVLNEDNEEQVAILIDLPNNYFSIGSVARMIASNETEGFNTCIPISALRGSDNQYFVLVFEEKDSILGAEYVARKVPVKVLDKNEQYVAIEAAEISNESEIIATSTKEISDGSRVKKRKNVVGDVGG